MTSTTEIEMLLKKAVTFLHSSHANSASDLRLMLDEEIKKKYGTEKAITNSLSKKQLEEEANFPGRAITPPPQPAEAEEVINLTNSPAKTISDSPDTIDSDDGIITAEEETNLKEFGDLNCCVCGEMMFTATNRLIECSKCGTLYHQECHKPPITEEEASEDQGHNWQCDNCCNKPATTPGTSSKILTAIVADEPALVAASLSSLKSKSSATSSRSSSSSNSSSPFYKMEQAHGTQASSGSGKTTSSSSHKSHKEERSTSSGMNSKISSTTLTSSKKHSSSSTSSSSKSKSSKHHESKRKSNK